MKRSLLLFMCVLLFITSGHVVAAFSCGDALVDSRDSKSYDTVLIGSQCWMAENINVGTMTAGVNDQGTDCPSAADIEKYCYSDDEGICTSDGALYQWDQAMCGSTTNGAQGICPTGWHIPTDAEQHTLDLGLWDGETGTCDASRSDAYGCTPAGTALKSGGATGFEGLLAGFRITGGSFFFRGGVGFFWSSLQSGANAFLRRLEPGQTGVGRYVDDRPFGFSVRCIMDPDETDPTISTLSPTDNATGVATNANVIITFDEAVDAETGYVTIKKSADDSTVEAIDVTSGQVTGSGTTSITVNPANNLDELIAYYVQIDATAFDDAAGNSFAGIGDATTWNFTTADETSPTISTLSPADNATEIATSTNLVITFDEAVDVETGNITIKKTSDDSTVEAIDVTSGLVTGTGTTIITINPAADLDEQTSYYIQIDATAFDDAAGNSFAGIGDATTWNFTTLTSIVPNSAPSVTTPYDVTQATDASGYITFKTKVSDPDNNLTQLKIEYSNNQNDWKNISVGAASASEGDVEIHNSETYRISSIDTDTGEITLTVTWRSKENIEGSEATVYFRVTPYDGVEVGDVKITESFSVDNAAPDISNMKLVDRTNTSLTIGWAMNVDSEPNFSSYSLCYKRGKAAFSDCNASGVTSWTSAHDSALTSGDTITTTITSLKKNTFYSLKLIAVDAFGNETTLDLLGVKTGNQEVINLLLDSIVANVATVIWDKAQSPTFTKYELCYGRAKSRVQGTLCKPNNKVNGAISQIITDPTTLQAVLSGFAQNVTYYAKLFVFDSQEKTIESNVLSFRACVNGYVYVGGTCVSEASLVTPTPAPALSLLASTPTSEAFLTPTPSPTPVVPSASPVPSPTPEPPDSGVIGGITNVINDIVETVVDVIQAVIEGIADVVVAVFEAVAEVVVAVVERADENIASAVNKTTTAVDKIITENAPAGVVATVKVVKEVSKAVAEEPVAQVANVVAAPAAAIAVASSTGSLTGLSQAAQQVAYNFDRLWQGLLSIFGLRTRKRPWGRVVNSRTGKPMPGAVVEIVDVDAQKVKNTIVTNDDGAFDTLLPPGAYQFNVQMPGWSLTPQAAIVKMLTGEKMYDGAPIRVGEEKIIPIVLAMRETHPATDVRQGSWRNGWQRIEEFFAKLSWPLLVFGFVLNTVIFLNQPALYNASFEGLYIVLIGMKILVSVRSIHAVGSIFNAATGQPVDLATVRLQNAETEAIVATRVTSAAGKFLFLPQPGVYTLSVSREGYEEYKQSHLVVQPHQKTIDLTINLTPLSSQSESMLTPQEILGSA